MTVPILYSFRRCPYAMRARLALAISATQVELREVRLSAKPEAMLAASDCALLIGDPAKATETLKWAPTIDFPTLVQRMVDADLELLKTRDARMTAGA